MFQSAAAFNADISKWDPGKVTKMESSTSTSVPTFCSLDGVARNLFLICFVYFNSPLCL